jgi:hypothetical protein
MDNKKPWQSKTLWIALIMAIVAFFPPVSEWIQANPEIFTMSLMGIFAVLRFISKGGIDIS